MLELLLDSIKITSQYQGYGIWLSSCPRPHDVYFVFTLPTTLIPPYAGLAAFRESSNAKMPGEMCHPKVRFSPMKWQSLSMVVELKMVMAQQRGIAPAQAQVQA